MTTVVLPSTLLALTLAQPWPRMFLVHEDPKRLENREWTPHRRDIGQWIALHGGRKPKSEAEFADCRAAIEWVNDRVWGGEEDPADWLGEKELLDLCVGGVFAVARLSRVVQQSDSPWWMGPYGWEFDELVELTPIPCPGSRRLWDVPAHVRAQVVKQLEAKGLMAAPVIPAAPAPVATPDAPEPERAPEPPRRASTSENDPYPYPDPGEKRRIPGLFCPGRAVQHLPEKPEPGRLYGLPVGSADWVTVSEDGQGTYSWCCRSRPGMTTGGRTAFQTFLSDRRAAAFPL